ncbi:hypothetical protein BUALT_Bualt04G0084600 [Buddleja alternifolia]|uniref:RNase H type-1 domain-containing protein n=1 Tax=Buddleja alternifolia TaxID=168488 RepID=A0AAV6XNM8_9LAMI|nr:hypothetical protein BUALT_Bualt04G0084600 [Buddleja alternifolia]
MQGILRAMDKDISVLSTIRRKLDFHSDEAEKETVKLIENCSGEKLVTECHSTILEKKFQKLIINRIFCCACQGYREIDKSDVEVKSHHPETRSGCDAIVKINCRQTGKYKVINFIAHHNGHDLVSPTKTNLLRSHRSITIAQDSQEANIEMSGITPRAGFQLMARQAGGRENVGFIFEDYRNDLRSKRTVEMKIGDTGGVFEYLQQRILCSHALKVFNIAKIPELYIMKRLTKKAKYNIVEAQPVGAGVVSEAMNEQDEKKRIVAQYKELCRLHNRLVTRAALTDETFRITKVGLLKMSEEVDASLENKTLLVVAVGEGFAFMLAKIVVPAKKLRNLLIANFEFPVHMYFICHLIKLMIPPDEDVIKLNFDGANLSKSGGKGCGTVAQDSLGMVRAWRQVYHPFGTIAKISEAMACQEALCMEVSYGWNRVVIEGDCLTLIRKLVSPSEDLSLWVF